ncbi:hypothetical protein S83_004075 [Arachis hypogaea]
MIYHYAMVCSLNQNRSIEAHFLLKRQGFNVSSYNTSEHVKIRSSKNPMSMISVSLTTKYSMTFTKRS